MMSDDSPIPTSPRPEPGPSHRRALEAFDDPEVAARYSRQFRSRRDQRARRTLLRILERVPAGAAVLDLPCGTGRLLSVLVDKGYRVTEADVSAHMLAEARKTWDELRAACGLPEEAVTFAVADILATRFPDREFDAVVCNRLFHHYGDRATRIAALRELGRIARGPVVVFFFDGSSLGGLRARLRYLLRRGKRGTHVVYSRAEIAANAAAAGLRLERFWPTRFSGKECFAVFVPEASPGRCGSV